MKLLQPRRRMSILQVLGRNGLDVRNPLFRRLWRIYQDLTGEAPAA
jgi:hypothetical protein